MKKNRWILTTTALAVAALTARADDGTETFRTLFDGNGLYQSQNGAGKPVFGTQNLAGHDLAAAAMGLPLGTSLTNQVLALQIDCASSVASLVVFDKSSSNNIATIANSTSFTVVQQQDSDTAAFPNRERFVAQFAINPGNNLLGGFLTLSGRLSLNPTNGCPRAIRITGDKLDRIFGDVDGKNDDDPKD